MKRLLKSLVGLTALAVAAGVTVGSSHAEDKVIRIGFQKYGTLILKSKGLLEEKLKPLG